MTRTGGQQPIPFKSGTRQTASLAQPLLCCTWSLSLLLLVAGCAGTQTAGADRSAPIEQSEYLTVDGAKLYLLTRGKDRQAPVLLWLHGGPGGAERPLFRYFNSELENHFVVAYWDQRGAGRSFDSDADPHQLTVARHLADLDVVVDHLRQALNQNQLLLVGHSWGGLLGMLYARQHPEKISSYISVAPVVSWARMQQSAYDFASREIAAHEDHANLVRLRKLGPPPYSTSRAQMALEGVMDQYGSVFHKQPCKFCVTLKAMLTGLVTPWEFISIHRGIHTSIDAMTPELLQLDLEQAVPQVDIPIVFILGRHDRYVESQLAADYFAKLNAPCKRLVWFEESAHNVPFEEPNHFDRAIIETMLPPMAGPCGK